ncbi:MAG: MtaA/CmuA family methyltransferase [Clostridiales bacterium]|jgi:[methyl-Co(III) methanol-specific corrinoid protein]:coenzyme M methyltransferase|nr:MtaA/CmuA family methyltransferase [Clostridiales bacterium]
MTDISPKERLDRALLGKPTDRAPVVCPGGMMNAAIVDVMNKTGHTLPEAHHDADKMSDLAFDVYENTGFENFGIPFCMTVEAEALGSAVDFGSLECEPKIQKEIFPSVHDAVYLPIGAIEKTLRAGSVIQAIHMLSAKHLDVPVIGSLTGPISAAASLIDPMTFLKQLRREKETSHKVIDYVVNQLISYAKLMADNGAAVISIADPTATGEILGPKFFDEYAVCYLNKITDAIHEIGVPVIIHICGDVRMVKPQLQKLHGDVLSVDAFVELKQLKTELGEMRTMGNLSTYLLEFGKADEIFNQAKHLTTKGIDVLAPACGLSTSTPSENIAAFTTAVKEG